MDTHEQSLQDEAEGVLAHSVASLERAVDCLIAAKEHGAQIDGLNFILKTLKNGITGGIELAITFPSVESRTHAESITKICLRMADAELIDDDYTYETIGRFNKIPTP